MVGGKEKKMVTAILFRLDGNSEKGYGEFHYRNYLFFINSFPISRL